MRRVGLALAVACVALALPAQASPLDPPPMLVVTGRGPTVATFTLRHEVQVDYRNATATFSGAYGGVVIEATRGAKRHRGGAYWVAALYPGLLPSAVTPQPASPLGEDSYVLDPGTYRAYLLADQEAEVRLPLRAGDAALTVHTTHPVRQVFATDKADFAIGQTSATLRKGVTVGQRAFLVLIGQHTGWTENLRLRVCLTKRAKPCNPSYDPFADIHGGLELGGVRTIRFPRDDVQAGARDVLLTATVDSTVKETVAYGYVEVDLL